MKTSTIAGSVAFAAAVVVASPSPVQLEARASGTSSGSLPTVTVKGNAFFAGDKRFYIRGVDYQPGGSSKVVDPLADEKTCTRDIEYFTQLGINTVRVYSVDNSVNHDACMNALAKAGIYVALDVNTPLYSINRGDPATSYNAVYLQSIFATIDAFAAYDNTLLFFSGNEVINDDKTANCAPYVKAVTRDMRQYRDNRGHRSIPIGYSAADVDSNRFEMAQYMNCGTDDQRSDFFAFNDYSWCDPSSYEQSGWSKKVEDYGNYSIPLFLSEYGCNTNTRKFEEVEALYNAEMTGVYSGGLVYEYSMEDSGYGLVKIQGDSVSTLPDFDALKSQLAANKAPSGDGGYNADGKASTCPDSSDTFPIAKAGFGGQDLPAMPSAASKYMKDGAGKGPGLTGSGSQQAGDSATKGTATPGSGSASVTASGAASTGSSSSSSSASPSTGAASGLTVKADGSIAPYIFSGLVAFSTLIGAALL